MKLIIAEDEYLARESLQNMDWAAIGVEVSGVAENGVQAIEMAKEYKPDIIISDIKMPEMDGLELTETITNLLPNTKVIILSAYNDFEFAQKAISCGVFEYMLKPYSPKDLLVVTERAVAEIMTQNQKNEMIQNITNQLEFSKYFMKNYYLGSLSEPVYSDDFKAIFGEYPEKGKYVAVVISFDKGDSLVTYRTNYRLFHDIIKNINKKSLNYIPFFEITSFSYIFSFDKNDTESYINSVILDIADDMSEYLNFSTDAGFVIGVGSCVYERTGIEYSYKSAIEALKYSFYLGSKSVICISDFESAPAAYNYELICSEEFFNCIKAGDTETAIITIKKLFDAFRENHESINTVHRNCHNIIVKLASCMMQCGHNPDILFSKTDVWSLIRQHTDIAPLEELIINTVDLTISQINMERTSKNKAIVQNVKKFILESPSTSLIDIAEHFHLSPNYLSKIFGQNSGTTIKNYIIQERINCAKEMLANTEKTMYDIALEVGYKTPQHFSVIFKKLTGVTPSKYRAIKKQ